jgi:FKBP-type peptidyl-prolyl cis-trans isomerase
MPKTLTTAINFLFAVTMLVASALAQSTSAAKPQQSSGANPQSAPATSGQTSSSNPAFKSEKDKISYAIGMNVGKNLQRSSIDVDPAIVTKGIQDTLAGKTLMTEAEAQAVLTQLQADMRKKQEEKAQQAGDANQKEGEAFLAANKAKTGVVTLPSGLQYKILKEGAGQKPSATDSVVCNYQGTLINGTEFDSSYKRGEPATFPVNGVIKGWTEALQLMPVGSKWQLFIPPDLAYGPRGAGPDIGPNATLIFAVELLSIKAKDNKDK